MHNTSKKQEILLRAANLFAERGYEAVSMRDLGKVLQMTPANLYHHFADKEALYREILLGVFARIQGVLELPTKGESPKSYLRQLVCNIIAFLLNDTVFTRLMFRELSSDCHERTVFLVENALRPIYDKIADSLAQLFDSRVVTNMLDMLVSSIIGYVHMSQIFSILHRDGSYVTDSETITSRILAALTIPEANSEA
ncbi:MAG: TetR/AcrR family transcriptional regulator [Desulfovibrionaceae bacterium]|nr:TetR/AcrR family transcriptional regulator [Desulfovibrionaceae bacterium]